MRSIVFLISLFHKYEMLFGNSNNTPVLCHASKHSAKLAASFSRALKVIEKCEAEFNWNRVRAGSRLTSIACLYGQASSKYQSHQNGYTRYFSSPTCYYLCRAFLFISPAPDYYSEYSNDSIAGEINGRFVFDTFYTKAAAKKQ